MVIRKAKLEDIKSVHNIETLSFNEGSYPLFVLRQLYDISEDYFLIAEKDGKIVGYALGHLSERDRKGWVLSLGVHPGARGNQIGKTLTKSLISLLEHNNSKEICLTVHPDNLSAIRIYNDLGFDIVFRSDDYYLDKAPRLLMKRKVEVL